MVKVKHLLFAVAGTTALVLIGFWALNRFNATSKIVAAATRPKVA